MARHTPFVLLLALAAASLSAQIVNPSTGSGGGAPATNPTGGANNYPSAADPTFTGNAVIPALTGTRTAPTSLGQFPMLNPLSNSSQTGFNAGLTLYTANGYNFGWQLGYVNGGFSNSLYAAGNGFISNCFVTTGTNPASQADFTCPDILGPTLRTLTVPLSTPQLIIPVTAPTGTTPALNAKNGLQTITLSGNTSPSITGITQGQDFTIQVCQPASGGPYTFTWPAAIHGGMTIGTTAGQCSQQPFKSFSGSTLVAVGPGVANVAP